MIDYIMKEFEKFLEYYPIKNREDKEYKGKLYF